MNRAIAALLLVAGLASAQVKAYRFGKVWDGTKVWDRAIVVVKADRIESIGESAPEGVMVTDLSRYTAIPGMIDVHTHMTYLLNMRRFTQSGRAAATVYLSQENARKTLETGVTTVRNLGASDYADIAMRDLINAGEMVGPRMFVSGYGLQLSRGGQPRPGAARGAEEVTKVVQQQIAAGADCIKMYGSTGSGQDVSGDQTFSFEEMKAAVDAAHAGGKRIAIHSYGPAGGRDAVRAGADSIEHAVDLDDATLQEMVQRGTYYVPTVDHNRYYADNIPKLGFQANAAERLNAFIERNLETTRKAVQAGVRIAMGSDAVYTMFGENTRELKWFVKAGMTPEQALRTATTNAAALLGMENRLGAIAPGYAADIAALDGDPLADIDVAIQKVRWVMKDGKVVVDKTKESQ